MLSQNGKEEAIDGFPNARWQRPHTPHQTLRAHSMCSVQMKSPSSSLSRFCRNDYQSVAQCLKDFHQSRNHLLSRRG